MPDFQKVKEPTIPSPIRADFEYTPIPHRTPTHCVTCMNHRDPDGFIDLLVEFPQGHLYLCAQCVYAAGQKLGMLSPTQADDLARRLGEALDAESKAKDALETEKDNKFVSLLDVQKLMKNQPKAILTPA